MNFNGAQGVGGVLGNKKVEPTFGVSFGLPYPTHGYPLNPYGPNPGINPYFGSISPNGLNLGVVNVNPLVSFQVTKNDYGEKVLKPLVNLHVTPNEHLIHKVGHLFHQKKHGIQQALYNKHYHHHTHLSTPPEVYHPHHHHHAPHYEGPSYYEGPSHYPSGPSHYPSGPSGPYGGGYGFYNGGGPYRDNSGSGVELDYDPSGYYSRSANVSFDQGQQQQQQLQYQQQQYNYQNVYPQNQNNFQPSAQDTSVSSGYANNYAANYYSQQQEQAPGQNRGSKNVAFPSNRRRRSADNAEEEILSTLNVTETEGRNAEKVTRESRERENLSRRLHIRSTSSTYILCSLNI